MRYFVDLSNSFNFTLRAQINRPERERERNGDHEIDQRRKLCGKTALN